MSLAAGADEDGTTVFLVERYLSQPATAALPAAVARVAALCSATDSLAPVRYLSSVHLPSEDVCFCVFRAHSSAAVRDVNLRGGFAVDRITDAVLLDLPPSA